MFVQSAGKYIGNGGTNLNKTKESWKDCRTAHELGDMDRPSITEWLRHLAGLPEKEPVPALEMD